MQTELLFNVIHADSGGEKILAGFILGGIVMLIKWLVSAGKEKITKDKVEKNPYDVISLEKLAVRDFEKGDLEAAIKKLEQIHRIDPNNFSANLYLAIIYHKDKEYVKSKPILENIFENIEISAEKAIEQKNNLAMASYCMGHIYFMDGDFEKAEKFKASAMALDKTVIENNYY